MPDLGVAGEGVEGVEGANEHSVRMEVPFGRRQYAVGRDAITVEDHVVNETSAGGFRLSDTGSDTETEGNRAQNSGHNQLQLTN